VLLGLVAIGHKSTLLLPLLLGAHVIALLFAVPLDRSAKLKHIGLLAGYTVAVNGI
jgi:hypothetical protein